MNGVIPFNSKKKEDFFERKSAIVLLATKEMRRNDAAQGTNARCPKKGAPQRKARPKEGARLCWFIIGTA